jgi:superfamily II DNA or RNA helicase
VNLPLIAPLKLRPYQQELVDGVISVITRGDSSTLVISPTASGKTVGFIKVCEGLVAASKDDEVVLILSHLDLLTLQTKKKFNKFSSLSVGILQGQKQPDPHDRVVISTMQSARDFTKIATYYEHSGKKVKYIITDEAHMKWSDSYTTIYNTFPNAQLIDFTATPFKNKRLATNGYDSIAFQISLQELIEQKYLVPPVLKQIEVENDTIEKKCAMVLRTYLEFEKGKKAIMFMKSKAECALLSDALTQSGVKSAVVTDNVKGVKREQIFDGYDGDEYDVLVSVNVLTAGFDALKCESVFMYGTESPTVYLQRVGRALRPLDGDSVKPHHSKQTARIYVFGDTPTIQSGVIEKHHNMAIKPKKYDDCKTLDEQIEWLEDNDLKDTDEYKFNKAAHKIQKLASKIDMKVLARMIDSKSISSEFMFRLATTVDKFKPIQGGDTCASSAQKAELSKLGITPSDEITSNEASLLIQANTGTPMGHHNSSTFVVKSGRYAGSHIRDIPWAYKSVCVKRFPKSEIAQLVRAYHKVK